MDAARPTADGPFDLIATSMTLHWLADPAAALATLRQLLAPGGVLIYATISGESFPEWREVLEAQGLPIGLLDIPELPGIVDEERIVADADTLGFLRRMKAVGGLTPREGYCRIAARRASPRHPRRRRDAWRPHHLAHRLWAVGGEPVEPLDQPGIGAGELGVGDAIRRHQIDRGAERPDVQAVAEEPVLQRLALRRLIASLALQIEGEDRAEHARPHHILAARKLAEHVAMPRLDPRNAPERVLLGEQHQGAERHGAGERIGGEGMAVRQRPVEVVAEKRLEHFVARDRHRHRHIARGQALGQADEVRHDAGLLHGEQRAGAPKAGRHLIEDDEHAGRLRHLHQALEELRTAHAHAAGALQHRLDDQRGDVMRAVPTAGLRARSARPSRDPRRPRRPRRCRGRAAPPPGTSCCETD